MSSHALRLTMCASCRMALEFPTLPESLRLATLRRLPTRLVVFFPEGEYTIRVVHENDHGLIRLTVHANIRAVSPGLGTWWNQWHKLVAGHEHIEDTVLGELHTLRTKIIRLLSEQGVQTSRIS